MRGIVGTLIGLSLATPCLAELRVKDIAHLQGQRVNKLMGYGLVVGLNGTGDGGENAHTMRALMALHNRYQQPVLAVDELAANDSVALVAVEATIPEFGAREGERLDVIVTVIGNAASLRGGQLLITPLQESMLVMPDIFALAGGKVELLNPKTPRRGIVRKGATLEKDLIYSFIDGQHITLVLNDHHAGHDWAHAVSRAVEHTLRTPGVDGISEFNEEGELEVITDLAQTFGGKNIRVRIPSYELSDPSAFIQRVLDAIVFEPPRQTARVIINRRTREIVISGNATVSPAILNVSGLGTITVGKPAPDGTDEPDPLTRLQALFDALGALQATDEQKIAAVEQLIAVEALHARVDYTE